MTPGLNYGTTRSDIIRPNNRRSPQIDYTGAVNAPPGWVSPVRPFTPTGPTPAQRPAFTGQLPIGPNAQAVPLQYLPGLNPPQLQDPQRFTYEEGGAIGPGGMPQRGGLNPPGGMGQPMDKNMLEGQVNQLAAQNPQVMQQIRQAIDEAIRSGELTPEELNTAIQMAKLALQNPQAWPQIRNFVIQQGIAGDQDLPQEYDQGLVVVLLVVAKAAQQRMGGQGGAATGQNPSMQHGGALPERSSSPSGKVTIDAHEGEYVIPAHVVKRKGTEFFDKLVNSGEPGAAARA